MSFEVIELTSFWSGISSEELADKLNELEKDYDILHVIAPSPSYYEIIVKKKVTNV